MQSGFRRVRGGRMLVAGIGIVTLVGVVGGLAGHAGAMTFPNVQCHGSLNGTALPDALVPTQN
jgi:hypothetical protein